MATFTRTLNITSTNSGSPTTITQNVAAGDQIDVTVNGPNGDDIFADADTNCSSSQGGAYSSGSVVALTSFSGSSYTYTMTTTDGDKQNPVFHYGKVTGTVTASITAPVVDNTQSFATTESETTTCDIALTSNGSGGTLEYNKSTSTTVPTSGWQSSSEVSVTRGTSYYLWARRGVGSEDRTDSDISVPYLGPTANALANIAGTDDNILWAATEGTTTVSAITESDHTYIVRRNNGLYRRSDEFTANGDVTIGDFEQGANGTPAQSSSESVLFYEFMVRRNTDIGGEPGVIDGTTGELSGGWTETNITFSITREKDPIAPVITVTGGTATIYVGDSYTDAGATATDNFAPANPTVVVVNPVDTAVIGTYTVTYNATDTAGNAAAEKTRTVNVVSGILGAFNTNQTGVELSSTNYAYAQYTGSTNNVLAARTAGTGSFVVTADATQPNSSLFTTAEKNIANGDYLHVRQTASASYSTAVSSTYRAGGPSGDTSDHTVTTRASNQVPDDWNWVDQPGAEIGTLYESQTHTIAGMEAAANLTFSGNTHNTAEMQIDGGTWTAVATVSVNTGTTIRLRALSSGSYSTTTTINTAVNGTARGNGWSIGTRAKDVTPVFPAFTAVGSTTPGQSYESNTVTISGIDPSVAVSITSDSANFAYLKSSTDPANYTSAAGTASNNDTFKVAHTAKPAGGAVTTTTLTIGDTSKSYVTTNAAAGTGMSVSPVTGSDVVDEGETATFIVTSFSESDTDFWWDVSPTDVDSSEGNDTTSYSAGSSKPYLPPTNIGGFNFTPTLDYIDDGAAGTGAETYTVTLYSDSDRTTVTASTTIQVNDNGQPVPPDLNIAAISDIVKDYSTGASHAVTVSSGNAVDVYSTFLSSDTSFATPLENSISAGNRILTVDDDSVAAGGSKSYVVAARRPVASNGNNQYYATNQSYTVYRRPGTATFTVGDDDAAANSVTVTLTITADADGYNTYQYQKNAEGFVATNTFNHLRTDSTSDYYVRAVGANGYVNTTDASVLNYNPGYIDPTISGAIANQTIDWDATTALVAFTNPTANHKYVVRSNNGATDRSDERTTEGNFTVSSGLPSVGAALTFELFTYLIATKGGLETYVQTDATCTITRSVQPVSTPTGISVTSIATTEAPTTTVTIEASGGSGATLQVSADNSTWFTSPHAFTGISRISGTRSFYARWIGAGSTSAVFERNDILVPFLDPKPFGSSLSGINLPYGTTDIDLNITGADSDHTYAFAIGVTTIGTITGTGTLSIEGADRAPAAGASLTYDVFARRGDTSGGSNAYVLIRNHTANTYPQTPSGLTTFTDGGTEDSSGTFTIAVGGTTGADSTTITLSSNYTTNAVANGSAIASVVRSGDIVYARNTGSNSLTAQAAIATPATYLDPNTGSIAGTDDSILWAATTGSTTVSGVLADHTYIVKRNNGLYRRSDEFTANGDVTIGDFEQGANGTPAQSSSESVLFYEFMVRRNTNTGGEPGVIDGTTGELSGGWTDTNRTFSITREKDPIAPVITVTGGAATIYVGDSYTDAGATATDNFAPANPTVVVVNPVDTAVIGTYTVTYNATDTAGNAAAEKTRTVNVVSGILGAFNTNQTGVELSSTNYAYAQYTGSTNNVLAARTAGTGSFVVTADATQPNSSLFTTAEKNIANGDYLHVRQTASASYSTAVSSTYRAGGPSGDTSDHTVTTRDPVKNPTNWNWTDPSGQELGVLAYSQTHTIAGMEAAANLTFSGNTHNTAEMQIDGGTWTAVATVSVNTGTTIRLRALSSGSYSTTTTINTAVNGTAEGGAFNITTRDAVAPVAPDSLVMADVATAAELTNVTATASGGETTGSYVQVSPDNSNWYANGTSFGSRTRNVEHTWYARNVGEDGSFSTSFSNTHTPGYLAPDTSSIAGTNDTMRIFRHYWATTTVSGVLSGHTYVVKKNNGDNDKPRSAIFTTNGALTISDNGVLVTSRLTFSKQHIFLRISCL